MSGVIVARKTIEVDHVRNVANRMLSNSVDEVDRNGVIVLIETILHDSGNYHGYRHTGLPADFDYESDDQSKWDKIDTTRRFYF